ncbi:MAG: hypothetical protein ACLTMP_13445 [Eggerthella lenta]
MAAVAGDHARSGRVTYARRSRPPRCWPSVLRRQPGNAVLLDELVQAAVATRDYTRVDQREPCLPCTPSTRRGHFYADARRAGCRARGTRCRHASFTTRRRTTSRRHRAHRRRARGRSSLRGPGRRVGAVRSAA